MPLFDSQTVHSQIKFRESPGNSPSQSVQPIQRRACESAEPPTPCLCHFHHESKPEHCWPPHLPGWTESPAFEVNSRRGLTHPVDNDRPRSAARLCTIFVH